MICILMPPPGLFSLTARGLQEIAHGSAEIPALFPVEKQVTEAVRAVQPVIYYAGVRSSVNDQGVADKRNAQSGAGDMIRRLLLVEFKDHSRLKAVKPAQIHGPFPCIVIRFQKCEGLVPEIFQGNRRYL